MSKKIFIPRIIKLPYKQHFFLFGARSTGKSTLLRTSFNPESCWYIDLLDSDIEEKLARHPKELQLIIESLPPEKKYVVIDEIQKLPKLLDEVHRLIENSNQEKYFILTGSSARKLKYGGANLLAGRAFVYHLYPFTFSELGKRFNLKKALQFGTLPNAALAPDDTVCKQFLRAYALTYLKEEIWAEQFIKKLDPFRKFLEVSAQCNGKIINYNNISRNVGADDKTIKHYFNLLEDTLLGFFLEPYHHSFRKRLSLKPKFYYFDLGVVHALTRTLNLPLQEKTSYYGEQFEHLIILECIKHAAYFFPDYRFSYLRTKDDVEIDLIVERPGLPLLAIEIKSSKQIQPDDLMSFTKITKALENCEAVCFSQDENKKRIEHVSAMHWQDGIIKFFTTLL